ncbi:ABC transporter substrate-binding protein [Oceanidesulfovibrio indonesiensis]|uniref:ABC transporter substrate-binding protein n=1 Tax=Oceanidesulfovibrio indonesiensis TaxID=54767 RepID=A0A7M3MAR4_9BACT|nr:ABC transporter substrate-binding protein [Oceanidesulfovibrio indonesiensis]TVM15018.1 ABC transporter substrate-binding protein [Oceanidesulfovibrio indonesiensis]
MVLRLILTACVALPLVMAAPAMAADNGPVVVGSKIDTEGALLGQMILHMLDANGFEVKDRTEFGPTPIVRKAITSGEIDIYPEYTGNGAFFFEDTDPAIWKDAEAAYEKVSALDYEKNKLVWLKPSPANNTWALAVRQDLADSRNLDTLEDFAAYVNEGGEAMLAGCEEFVTRADALPAFEEAYGFDLKDEQMVVFSGCNTAQTEKAAAQGTSGVNVAMAFGTDGALAALGLKVLEDTKGVQPVYAPTPVVREAVLEKHPQIRDILAPVFESLHQETLQQLNAKIAVGGESARNVALGYLQSQGFVN